MKKYKQSHKLIAVTFFMVAVFFTFISCSGNEISQEDQVRLWIKRGVEAVEKRDRNILLDMISEDYKDNAGRDKKDMEKMLFVYFLKNRKIYLFHHINEIVFSDDNPEYAMVKLQAAVTGREKRDNDIKGNLVYVEMSLKKDDVWLLTAMSWKRAL
ncbi:MAG: hypothetical protein D6B27_05125 [Gammaproteobacteria bacterium]|nr:MAG: hypothetical protein D6B27_05125 [Gammaproteobacteria bacterium]